MSRSLVHRRLHRPRPRSYRWLLLLAAASLFSFVGCTAAVVGGVGTAYAYVTRGLPNPNDLASRPLAQVTQIYDRTGQTLLYEFYEERRIYIPLKDVSDVDDQVHPGGRGRQLLPAHRASTSRA